MDNSICPSCGCNKDSGYGVVRHHIKFCNEQKGDEVV